jgi:hypothetical protein
VTSARRYNVHCAYCLLRACYPLAHNRTSLQDHLVSLRLAMSKPHVGNPHHRSARLSAKGVLDRRICIPIKNARLGSGESDIQPSPSIFPPLMANGRNNAEDSGPEGAPESFFLGADPNSHRHLFSYGLRQLDGNQTTVPLFSNWRFAFYGDLLALVVFDVRTFCLRQRLIS